MKILFMHNNYPAQFVHLLSYFSSLETVEIVFVSEFASPDVEFPRVRHIKVGPIPSLETDVQPQKALMDNYIRAQFYGKILHDLQEEGWLPDVIIEHAGWGCATFAADIFPNAVRISYFEWFYNKGEYFNFFAKNHVRKSHEFIANRQRNLCQLDSLQECTIGISPTYWQFSQYPHEYVYKMHILHEGIDTNFYAPLGEKDESITSIGGIDVSGMEEVVTYAARGMEPTRGFPQFYNSIPLLLKKRPQCHVVIMANDTSHYDPLRPDKKGWGEFLRENFPLDPDRVHFLPYSAKNEYRSLLRRSDVHVYLTAPFVLSWSMLEAMSCECLLVASDTQPVREVIRHAHNGFLTSFWDVDEISDTVATALQNKEKYQEIRKTARKHVQERFDARKSVNQFLHILNHHTTR